MKTGQSIEYLKEDRQFLYFALFFYMLSPVVNVCVHGKIELSNQTTVDLQNKKREEVFVKAKIMKNL